MTLSADDLLKQIQQRQFQPVYFLQGEEPYYIDLIADRLEQTVLPEHDRGFNQVVLYGKDVDVATILGQAKRFPMMAERSVVIVKEAQAIADLEAEKSWPFLEAYLKNPLTSTVLVFCYKHKTLDARKKLGKLLGGDKKEPAPAGTVLMTSKKVYDNHIPAFIAGYVRSRQQSIGGQATAMLAEYIGTDLGRLTNEIDKLLLNVLPGHSIDEDLVQRMVGISKEYNIFELQKALIQRDVLKANRILTYFEANPKANPLIPNLTLLFGFFTKLLVLHQRGNPSDADFKKLGIMNSFAQKDYSLAMRVYDFGRTRAIIHLIRRADLQSKGVESGSMTDGEILRELVFLILHPVPLSAIVG
ncbi:DNA polymerase III, delta subunit [Hymenobacter daecheongensis DSM 21074]|uniref:DNA polymerase III subunit delta n=1 Tax=Hymenobacter daecheongensis DSM 21074 TaxID=1121955 RepID=A0A1M6K6R0_9BACT|nr:DNA polymerase III subunit delta [Hymenobacter daecheongensis]SHJ54530.1 DNA polymerase III, delta subunit [Hymenobacter daecheongensis DSM 21074]